MKKPTLNEYGCNIYFYFLFVNSKIAPIIRPVPVPIPAQKTDCPIAIVITTPTAVPNTRPKAVNEIFELLFLFSITYPLCFNSFKDDCIFIYK